MSTHSILLNNTLTYLTNFVSIAKVQLLQWREGAFCTGLPDGPAIKADPGGSVDSLQPAIDTATPPRGHNLNYTIWILYAESVS